MLCLQVRLSPPLFFFGELVGIFLESSGLSLKDGYRTLFWSCFCSIVWNWFHIRITVSWLNASTLKLTPLWPLTRANGSLFNGSMLLLCLCGRIVVQGLPKGFLSFYFSRSWTPSIYPEPWPLNFDPFTVMPLITYWSWCLHYMCSISLKCYWLIEKLTVNDWRPVLCRRHPSQWDVLHDVRVAETGPDTRGKEVRGRHSHYTTLCADIILTMHDIYLRQLTYFIYNNDTNVCVMDMIFSWHSCEKVTECLGKINNYRRNQ